MSDTITTDKPASEAKPAAEGVQHDLDYYLAHPQEMPTDTEAIEKLFSDHAAKEGAGGDDKKPPEEKPAADPKPDAKAPGEEKIDGVLAKDGKNVIPYAEMERRINAARESQEAEAAARTAAEDYVKQLEQNIRDLNARIEAGDPTKPEDKPVSMDLPKEVMEVLETEFPTQAKAIKAQQALFKHLADKFEALEARVTGTEKERSADAASEVQDLISQVPELAEWQKGNATQRALFARAQEIEGDILNDKELLKTKPELKKDDVARYKEVVARVKQEVGLPASTPADEKTELERADKVIEGQQPTAPRSLSDMPAGKPPANSATESLENLSAAEIGTRFMGMTPDKIQEQLARL